MEARDVQINVDTTTSTSTRGRFGPLLYGADACLWHEEDRSGSAFCLQCWMNVVEAAARGRDLPDERPADIDG